MIYLIVKLPNNECLKQSINIFFLVLKDYTRSSRMKNLESRLMEVLLLKSDCGAFINHLFS